MNDQWRMHAASAGFVYFAVVFMVGFAHGTLRVFVFIPLLQENWAVLLDCRSY